LLGKSTISYHSNLLQLLDVKGQRFIRIAQQDSSFCRGLTRQGAVLRAVKLHIATKSRGRLVVEYFLGSRILGLFVLKKTEEKMQDTTRSAVHIFVANLPGRVCLD
jgi:hypothetical protein